jgi:23S rRNA (guanosine2251-2'-O)-methyltransferase
MHDRSQSAPGEKSQFIFGLRPVIEAVKSGKEIEKVLIQDRLAGAIAAELKELLKEHGVLFQYVPVEKLNRLTRQNHQGVIAFISSISYQPVESIVPMIFERGETPLLLILDRVTDVRNFGAIARTAECAGVHCIIIPSRGAAQINADAIKTSAGALNSIPVCREHNLKFVIEYLQQSGIQVIACTEKTDQYYYTIDLTVPTAIIMGSEENGISGEYLKKADAKARLPLNGRIESLNVSVASGIILYEALRQRAITAN